MSFLRDFLTAEDKEGVFNADHFPLWYKRAAEQVPGTFVYSVPFSTGTQNKTGDKKWQHYVSSLTSRNTFVLQHLKSLEKFLY